MVMALDVHKNRLASAANRKLDGQQNERQHSQNCSQSPVSMQKVNDRSAAQSLMR